MNIHRILCPVDFSEAGHDALDLASSLAREHQAKLFIVHVEDSPTPYGPGLHGMLPTPVDQDRHQLWQTLPSATEVTFEHDLLFGDPAHEIVECVGRENIDLVVMGSHGRSGLSRVLMGSVAEKVVRGCPVPVLTLRPDTKKLVGPAAPRKATVHE